MLKLFVAPIDFFSVRVMKPPSWPAAIAVLTSVCCATIVAALVMTRRGRDAFEPALIAAGVNAAPGAVADVIAIAFAVIGFVASFSLMTGAVVLLDSLFSQSGRVGRLIEFSALAHVVQLPWALIAIALAGWSAMPELHLPFASLSSGELQRVSQRYQSDLLNSPIQIGAHVVSMYVTVWIAALQAAALRVVSGFSARGAWAAAGLLGGIFGVLPWAWQTFT